MDIPHDIGHGIRNVIRWTPVIWFDKDFDWYDLAAIMEYKLRRMAKVSEHGRQLEGPRIARQMRVCAELLRRMREDEYVGQECEQSPNALRSYKGEVMLMREIQDQRYLGLLIGKYLMRWWD